MFLFQRKHQKNLEETIKKRLPILSCSSIFAIFCVLLWLFFPRWPSINSDKLKITLLDVAQGESIFIEFPNEKTLLVDGGGFYKNSLDIGKTVVAPFILNQGFDSVDYIMATHSDQDHIAGLETVVGYLNVRNIFIPTLPVKDQRLLRLVEKAKKEGANVSEIFPEKNIKIGNVSLTFFHPNKVFTKTLKQNHRKNRNNQSMVFRLDYENFSVLFTGDIEAKAESFLVKNKAPLSATILKLPHHGSKFSTTPDFLKAVNPKAAIVSSGYLNSFGHPHPNVLERIRQAGAEFWRTDLNGAIKITSDGRSFEITPKMGRVFR